MEKKEPSPPMKPWLSTALGIVIPALVTVILFTYVTFFVTIPHIKENLLQGQYNIVQAEVSTVLSTLYHYYQLEHEGKISKQTAQNSAKEIIRHLRYGDNEYFFIVDYNYFSIMHPLRPYLENKNMADIKDSNGKPFIKLLVDMAKQKQQGFLNYMWYPKGNQQQKQIPKVAYVKCFAPWQWVVGSGIYMGDALHQIKLTVRKTIIINLTIICITLLLLLIIIFQSIKTIKKQQLTQQALQESEQQLRLMYMNSPNAIVLITDKKVVACNPAAEKMMGFCSQDIIGKSANEFSPLFQPDGKPSNEKALEKMALVRTEGPQRFEWILQKKDGTTLWIDVMISSLLYHNKPSIMASWRDITERKTMEAELRDSNQALAAEKERLAVTLRSIGDGVITTDTQGKVLSLNKVAEKLTGWSHQEACAFC